MKKNLFTFLFVVAFLCGSAFVVSAKNSLPSENSATLSKKAAMISKNINVLEAKCKPEDKCAGKLKALQDANAAYEAACAPDYPFGCAPQKEIAVLNAALAYERCLCGDDELNAKNTDRTVDRSKIEKSLRSNAE